MAAAVKLNAHPSANGRWGQVTGIVTPRQDRVYLLVFSHDEKWYRQATGYPDVNGRFTIQAAFGLDAVSDKGREYIAVAFVGPDLPSHGVFEDLNMLPPGVYSNPISVERADA